MEVAQNRRSFSQLLIQLSSVPEDKKLSVTLKTRKTVFHHRHPQKTKNRTKKISEKIFFSENFFKKNSSAIAPKTHRGAKRFIFAKNKRGHFGLKTLEKGSMRDHYGLLNRFEVECQSNGKSYTCCANRKFRSSFYCSTVDHANREKSQIFNSRSLARIIVSPTFSYKTQLRL